MIDFHYSDSWADPGKQNKPDKPDWGYNKGAFGTNGRPTAALDAFLI